MREPERGPDQSTRQLLTLFVRCTRFIEASECFKTSRESCVRSVEAWIELERHSIIEHRLLKLSREVVSLAATEVMVHRKRIELNGPADCVNGFVHSLKCIGTTTEKPPGVRVRGIQLDGFTNASQASSRMAGVCENEAERCICVSRLRVDLDSSSRCFCGSLRRSG